MFIENLECNTDESPLCLPLRKTFTLQLPQFQMRFELLGSWLRPPAPPLMLLVRMDCKSPVAEDNKREEKGFRLVILHFFLFQSLRKCKDWESHDHTVSNRKGNDQMKS